MDIILLFVVFIIAILASWLLKKLHLPGLIGMLITGIVFGPYLLDFLHLWLINRSADFRLFALILILLRAGLSLDLTVIRKIRRSVFLVAAIPPLVEILTVTIIAPFIFPISILDAAIMGTVLSAVSPAIVVPRMIKRLNETNTIESSHSSSHKLPQLMIAVTTINGVVTVLLFSILLSFEGVGANLSTITRGVFLPLFIVTCGLLLQKTLPSIRDQITRITRWIWIPTEILLFVLVGATLDLQYVTQTGLIAVLIIVIAVCIRMIAVYISLTNDTFTRKEKVYCAIAYIPKATVQATIGGTALALGLPSGQIILVVAVLSILITAPIGAMLMENFPMK